VTSLLKKGLARLDGGQGLARGAAISFAIRIAGAVLGFALNVLIARLFGAEGTGLYFLALTVAGIASLFGRFGLENAVLRFVSTAASESDWGRVRAISRRTVLLALASSTVVSVLLFLIAGLLATRVFAKPELADLLRILTLSIFPMALVILYGAMLKALQRIRDSQIIEAVIVPLVLLIAVAGYGYRFGVQGAVFSFVFAVMVSASLGAWLWHRACPAAPVDGAGGAPLKLLSTSASFVWIQLMNAITDWADILILGALRPVEEVGIYGVAKRLAMTISFVLIAVNNIAAPKFAALHHQGDHAALARVAVHSARLTLLVAGPVLLALMLFSTFFMGMFGKGFEAGATVLVVLALGQLVNVATGSVGQLLAMTGHEKLLRNITIGSIVLSLILCAVLVPKHGMVGAAIAVAVSIAVENLIKALYVQKCLGFRAHAFTIGNLRTKP
jgi:O-antigen/teichoic acid export membrane protein